MFQRAVKCAGLVFAIAPLPPGHGAFFQRKMFVYRGAAIHCHNPAQAGAGGASPLFGIKRKMGAGELWHPVAAAAAIHPHQKFTALLFCGFHTVGCTDRLPAGGAAAHPQLFEQHAKAGVNVSGGANGGAGVFVGAALADEDRGPGAPNPFHLGFGDSLEAHGLQVLALAFHVKNVPQKGGFART